MRKLYFLDKYGWPIETIKGRWFLNFFRRLIHTRKITFKAPGGYLPITDYYKLVEELGIMPEEDVRGVLQECMEFHTGERIPNRTERDLVRQCLKHYKNNVMALQKSHTESLIDAGYQIEPNALTLETLEKSERGEDVRSVDTVEELFKELDKDD